MEVIRYLMLTKSVYLLPQFSVLTFSIISVTGMVTYNYYYASNHNLKTASIQNLCIDVFGCISPNHLLFVKDLHAHQQRVYE